MQQKENQSYLHFLIKLKSNVIHVIAIATG